MTQANNNTNTWVSNQSLYDEAGNYKDSNNISNQITVDIYGKSHKGVWIQIDYTTSVVINMLKLNGTTNGQISNEYWSYTQPNDFAVLGSNDESNWTLITEFVNLSLIHI